MNYPFIVQSCYSPWLEWLTKWIHQLFILYVCLMIIDGHEYEYEYYYYQEIVDQVLVLISRWRSKDPEAAVETEVIENLFNVLCFLLVC